MTLKYDKRNRDNLEKLAPNTRAAAFKWYEDVVKTGIEILVYQTIRTLAEQKLNVKNGVSQTLKSYHLVGQALDFCGIDSKGQERWNGYYQSDMQIVIGLAKKYGFTWGGDWSGFKDCPHLQFNYKGYGTDKALTTSFKPTIVKAPYEDNQAIVPYPNKLIKVGSRGMDVKRIQNAVNVKPDGIFGNDTKEAVKKYQERKGLDIDGIVGLKTWNMLF